MKNKSIGIAVAALALGFSHASAQSQKDGGPQPGREMPSGGNSGGGSGAASKGLPDSKEPSSQAPATQPDRAQVPDKIDGRDVNKNTERDQRGSDTKGHADAPDKANPKRNKQQTQKDQAQPTKERADSNQKRGVGEAVDQRKGNEAAKSGAGSVQLTGDQRTRVKTVFAKHKSRAAPNLNITVNVGVHVPRTVHLDVIPEDVVIIVPQYRRYRYFIVDDSICIVEPDTYVIVDVVHLA